MRALLLAAGFGSRLRPLTNSIPKCMVPIKGVPLLDIWLDRLKDAGIGPFLINTHYLSEQVVDFISQGPHKEYVTLKNEVQLLGTAGTLIANLDFFQDTDGLLVHADNYCLADFSAFMDAHHKRPKNCVMTMMTFKASRPSSCGIVVLDNKGVVIDFFEKKTNPPGDIANGAIYILSPEFFKEIKSWVSPPKDFSSEVIEKFLGRIYSYETKSIFLDIGTPESFREANELQ